MNNAMNIVNVGYDSTNYYVLADAAPRLLVDAGWPGTLPKLRRQCQRMGVTLPDLKYMLITHYHPDHAGLVQDLKNAGMTLVVIDLQIPTIPALRTHMKPGQGYLDIDLTDNCVIRLAESRAFLAEIGIAGEIIHTPGHSDDSVSLILDGGAAFTGDLTPPMMVPDDPANALYQSWQAIRAHSVTQVYPGHGPVWQLV
ncbi:MBL fold metallo-hydrolase [Aggregatilinea lenta]|uniref:MBL fold metallo-hydrolase n=1 Tax=Aggregatilinea lenta TaxID=913108 RepID=UPI000E5B5C0B|nr:MBL fold metallo-hydrolase [Aggregatilinea lenta]